VQRLWQTRANEFGEPLSPFEREALIERHCELFGCWPDEAGKPEAGKPIATAVKFPK
jgi:hypothetical protein